MERPRHGENQGQNSDARANDQPRRLSLRRKTIRRLDMRDLAQVRGGDSGHSETAAAGQCTIPQ